MIEQSNLLNLYGARILIAIASAYVGTVLGDYVYHWGTNYASRHIDKLLDPFGPIAFCVMGLMSTPLTRTVAVAALCAVITYVAFQKLPWWSFIGIVILFAVLPYVTMFAWLS